jgi:hypothetical protein
MARPSVAITAPSLDTQLFDFERGLLNFLERHGLPTASIFAPVQEREVVLRNLDRVLTMLAEERCYASIYIAKFIAAVSSGLFDAALNYLWDETIFELRQRVARYDLSYFFDNAVRNEEKRRKLAIEADLEKIEDSELIHGAREIGLLSELGYRHLDFIRYNLNWASAAHPNQNALTGLQLITWLETCIREVIALPLSDAAIEIRKLLANVRSTSLSTNDARDTAAYFAHLAPNQANTLASGFFGMYIRPETTAQTRQNIQLLLFPLWERVDEATRRDLGLKYGRFAANNDQEQKRLARQFLETVEAQSYFPDDLRAAELLGAIDDLVSGHRATNNFYTEPALAREL